MVRLIGLPPMPKIPTIPMSLHKYTYVHNNPVNAIDPSGMFFMPSNWFYGKRVHDEIGYHFLRMFSTSGKYDQTINRILGTKVEYWGCNRPDLVSLPIAGMKRDVWEIKPEGSYLNSW